MGKLQDKIKALLSEVKRLKRLSLHDDLTGLFNHRQLTIDIERYLEIQKRDKNINFIVAILDIDNFKKYNDKYGHKKGDFILRLTAKIIKNNIRKYEKAYRMYTGDEFAIIFSHTDTIEIAIYRINKELKKHNIEVSIGYSKLNDKNSLEIADQNLFKEKRNKQ